jgi:predicted nuclease with TOPRIM domain
MNDFEKDVQTKLSEHDVQIRQNTKDIDMLKEQQKTLNDLTVNIKLIAQNTNRIQEEQTKQSEKIDKVSNRINELEQEPGRSWTNAKRTAFNTIVGVVAGALATGMILLIANMVMK